MTHDNLPPELERALAQELEAMTTPASEEPDTQLWRSALDRHRAEERAADRGSGVFAFMRQRWATAIVASAATLAITSTVIVLTPDAPTTGTQLAERANASPDASGAELAGELSPLIGGRRPGYDGSTPLGADTEFARAEESFGNDALLRQESDELGAIGGRGNGARAGMSPADARSALASGELSLFDSPEPEGVLNLGPGGSTVDRQIVRTVRLELRVAEPDDTFARASAIVREPLGEYVQTSSRAAGVTPDDPSTSQITLRLSSLDLEAQLDRLRGMGDVLFESSSVDDVAPRKRALTEQLRSQRRAETAVQTMAERSDAPASLDTSELEEIRADISRTESEMRHLDAMAEHATVLVTIRR